MQAVESEQPTQLVNKYKKVRIWHRRFGHARNPRIIRASKFFTIMGDFNNTYDPTKVYGNLKQFNYVDDEVAKTPENPEKPA